MDSKSSECECLPAAVHAAQQAVAHATVAVSRYGPDMLAHNAVVRVQCFGPHPSFTLTDSLLDVALGLLSAVGQLTSVILQLSELAGVDTKVHASRSGLMPC